MPYRCLMMCLMTSWKTTITGLTEDDRERWHAARATGLTLADVFRRGLDEPRHLALVDPGQQHQQHAAAPAPDDLPERVTRVEQRLAVIEAELPFLTSVHATADAEPLDPAQLAAQAAERERAEMDDHRARLIAGLPSTPAREPIVATAAQGGGIWHVTDGTARGRLRELVAYGYATQRTTAPGAPYEWEIHRPGAEPTRNPK